RGLGLGLWFRFSLRIRPFVPTTFREVSPIVPATFREISPIVPTTFHDIEAGIPSLFSFTLNVRRNHLVTGDTVPSGHLGRPVFRIRNTESRSGVEFIINPASHLVKTFPSTSVQLRGGGPSEYAGNNLTKVLKDFFLLQSVDFIPVLLGHLTLSGPVLRPLVFRLKTSHQVEGIWSTRLSKTFKSRLRV